MKNKFIIDKEINLNENDFLNTKAYSKNLSEIIENVEPNKVFTIGLFGKWGTGKSSIIKTSEQDFNDSNYKFITYDAWQFVNDSFRRMFLRKIREELRYEETSLMQRFYENETIETGFKYQLSTPRLLFILCAFTIVFIFLTIVPIGIDYKTPIYAIFTILGLIITIISGAFHQLKISISKPLIFAPEQFEDCFKEMVSNSLSKSKALSKWVKGDKSIQNLTKIIIVIDNIDRCSSDIAYSLLSDIKTFFSSSSFSIIFVVPVDDEALLKHLVDKDKTPSQLNNEKEEFLRKFFNLTLRIKPYNETDMFSFAKKLVDKTGLDFKPETINIASKEYAKNPRRIIQLFNNLIAELNYFPPEFVIKNETLICCMLIIREEYPDFYNQIINSPKTLTLNQTQQPEDLGRFIRIAQIALGEVNLNDLVMIISNTKYQFENVSIETQDAIESFDAEKILSVWEAEKDILTDVIIDKINNCIKNQLINTELVGYFDLCLQINKTFTLENQFANRIDEKVLPYLSTIIAHSKNFHNLCKYALDREKQTIPIFKKVIIETCNIADHKSPGFNSWIQLFDAVIYNFRDKATSVILEPTFTIYHQQVTQSNLSPDQFEFLLSDIFVLDRISAIPDLIDDEPELDTSKEEYQKLIWLFKNKKNIMEDGYSAFFNKVTNFDTLNFDLSDVSYDRIVRVLKYINPILVMIPDRIMAKGSHNLYNLVTKEKSSTNNRYRYNPSPFVNFVDECIEKEVNIPLLTDFIINMYRISNCQIDISTEIEKLLDHTNLDSEILFLINNGFEIQKFILKVFESLNDYSKIEVLSILKYCFTIKGEDGDRLLSIKEIQAKLGEVIDFALENNENQVFELIEWLNNDSAISAMLTELIKGKDSKFINKLPVQILKNAIFRFNKDNFNDFASNYSFLITILQYGSNSQKAMVMKIITTNIDDNKDIYQTLNLIDSINDISNLDRSNMIYSHLDNFERQNNENIDDQIKKKITELKKRLKK